ncbi:MAG TPA: hypothetical protein VGN63_22660 [Flavisolibacter sp.]|jgi:hypothetical protein|nr:hypothetical protein [Flavisolibacter sp.]
MENLFVFLATSLVLRATGPRFKRYLIRPGCSTFLHSSARTLHVRYTKDGDKVLFNEYVEDDVTYGTICVQMREEYTLAQAENILVNYMNRVRKPMHITCNVSMESKEEGRHLSITDYWQDSAGSDWKVKGYTNGKIIAVLYVKNIGDTTVNNHDAFLNGFRFSGT